jgi:hypothetical protein
MLKYTPVIALEVFPMLSANQAMETIKIAAAAMQA